MMIVKKYFVWHCTNNRGQPIAKYLKSNKNIAKNVFSSNDKGSSAKTSGQKEINNNKKDNYASTQI